MSNNTSPQYWRNRKSWSAWVGRKGIVLASTLIHVGNPALAESTPYPYVLVEFGNNERRSFVGVGHAELLPGETVECVWRKMGAVAPRDVVQYGIKVQRYSEAEDIPTVPLKEVKTPVVEEKEEESHDVPAYR